MAGRARRIPPEHSPDHVNSKHAFDLYRISISPTRMIADQQYSRRPSRPIGWQVFHKVIHRLWASSDALARRAARGPRLAGRDARALEWRVRRHAERCAGPAITAYGVACGANAWDAAAASFPLHFFDRQENRVDACPAYCA